MKFSLAHASAAANLTGPCVMSTVISRTRAAHANTNGNSAVGAAVVVVTAAVIVTSKSLAHATAREQGHRNRRNQPRTCHCGDQSMPLTENSIIVTRETSLARAQVNERIEGVTTPRQCRTTTLTCWTHSTLQKNTPKLLL